MAQKVLISVDTEGPAGKNPVDTLIFGKTGDGKEYGIRYLMRIFDKYKVKGLFFVDLAEAWDCGTDKIAHVLKVISDSGHDTGVHLHPDHMMDRHRRYLWEYSYGEQYEMISKCTDLYEKILGKHPLSFRAGRYGANNDTIKILEQMGYKYDMSYFAQNKYCKIISNKHNKIFEIDGIKEVPVTSFRSVHTPLYSRNDKIDCGQRNGEFKKVLRKICENDSVDVISFFVHSFSLLNWRCSPDNPGFSKVKRNRLINSLEIIKKNKQIRFISESDLQNINIGLKADSVLDVSDGITPFFYFAERAFNVVLSRIIRNV